MIERLLVIGRTQGMDEIFAPLLPQARNACFAPTIPMALAEVPTAELILVLQHYSDEFPRGEIRALLAQYPIARMVVCQSPWCASDGRTRQHWPSAVCVSWSSAPARIQGELEVLAGKRVHLPWTAGLDEIFAFDHGS